MQFPTFGFGSKRPYKIGVALSGGGARGFAHVGALQALEEMGIRPDVIAGVSAGSIVSVMYAAGIKPAEMLELFTGAKFTDFCELSVPKDGFFKMTGFKKFLQKHIPYSTLEELPIPTIVCATDLDRCERVAFDKGEISDRVLASCCMPIIFKPIIINGVHYVDGGVLHNLPAWAIRDKCKYLIGINCSPMPAGNYKHTLLEIAHRSYNMMAKSNAHTDMSLCDIAVETSEIARYQVFNLKEIKKVYRNGYETTMKTLLDNGFRHPDEFKAGKENALSTTTPKSITK